MTFLPRLTSLSSPITCGRQPGVPVVLTERTAEASLPHRLVPAASARSTTTRFPRSSTMGKRRGIKSKQKAGQLLQQQPDQAEEASSQPLLLAFQPVRNSLALSEGSQVSIYTSSSQEHKELLPGHSHIPGKAERPPAVQTVAFDAQTKHLVVGGDNKALQLWSAESWQLLHCWQIPKRISAAAFSADGQAVYFADKWGDVHAVRIPSEPGLAHLPAASSQPPSRLNKGNHDRTDGEDAPALLLGHFCSIVTSLSLSADGRFIVSTDRDGKVRVSNLPADPLQGAPEIQSYCLGHTAFATCSAFIRSSARELLLSGSGDGTVRLWEHVSGAELARWNVPEQAPSSGLADVSGANLLEQEQNGTSEVADEHLEPAQDNLGDDIEADEQPSSSTASGQLAVLALSVSPTRPDVAVIVEGSPALTVLTVDLERPSLQQSQQLSCGSSGQSLPAAVSFDSHGRLWAAAKVPCESGTATELHVWLPSEADAGYQALSHPEVLSLGLQQALLDHSPQSTAAGAAAPPSQASQQLRKRHYTEQEINLRKAQRRNRV